jgi:hypothetical protein
MAAEWQDAMEALIFVVTLGGPTMFALGGNASWHATANVFFT